jgi:hypothetical protein
MITRNGGGAVNIEVELNNDGLIQGVAGTLRLVGGNTPGESDSGTIDVAAGAVVEMTGGTRTFVSPAKEQGAGRLRIAGGTLTGVFRIEGTAEWFGGTMTGPGTTTVAAGGTILVTSSAFNMAAILDGGHTLLNQGTVDWSSSGGIDMGTGAVFANADGGRLDITSSSAGEITRNGAGATDIAVELNNDGVIHAAAGTLRLEAGSTPAESDSGSIDVAAGGVVELVSGTSTSCHRPRSRGTGACALRERP